MSTKSIIASVVMIVVLAGAGIGLYCAWPAITGTINDNKYYTAEEVQEIVDDAVNNAFSNKDEMSAQIDYYKDLTDEYYLSILDYQMLVGQYEEKQTQDTETIKNLTAQKNQLETDVSNLQTVNTQHVNTISSLNSTISSLQLKVSELEASDGDKSSQIALLKEQIASLQTLVSQLQETVNLNNSTIASLRAQIVVLTNQIADLTAQINNSGTTISSLNNKISQLEQSIAYYESYIASLESGEQIIITAEFNGSVYNIQVINKGGKISIVDPVSTERVIFNYWMDEDGTQIDLSTKTFSESTKIIANITLKYDVKFNIDGSDTDTQLVVSGSYAIEPEQPTKTGYTFAGWSLDGKTAVTVSETPITVNTTFFALWSINSYLVTFDTGDVETTTTQQVNYGAYAIEPEQPTKTGYTFSGWSLNGSTSVTVSSTVIVQATTFTALWTINSYTVQFNDGTQVVDTQSVNYGTYASEPSAPTKTGYTFKGWSLDGANLVTVSSTAITQATTFFAVWEINTYTVTFDFGDFGSNVTQQVEYGSTASIPNIPEIFGYYFAGFSLNNVDLVNDFTITDNTTYYAIYRDFIAGTYSFEYVITYSNSWVLGTSTSFAYIFDIINTGSTWVINNDSIQSLGYNSSDETMSLSLRIVDNDVFIDFSYASSAVLMTRNGFDVSATIKLDFFNNVSMDLVEDECEIIGGLSAVHIQPDSVAFYSPVRE